ncbi:MAG TPA: FtsX-like permease family protein [Dehalococcoidia bacterium]|nr:FtsX-like permease family protein [Dehalococcoidia bacterium]
MDSLFGVSTTDLARFLIVLSALVLVLLAVLGLRRRTLLKLGLRNAARRPLRSVVIVIGLMLSTVVIATAFSTGDAMTLTVRSLISGSIGRVDETVTASPNDPTQITRRSLDNLASGGGLMQVSTPYFDQEQFQTVSAAASKSHAIAGVMPAILEQAPAAADGSQLIHPGVGLLALPPRMPAGFSPLKDTAGAVREVAALGATDVYLNQAAADLLGSGGGQRLQVYLAPPDAKPGTPPAPTTLAVAAVVQNGDLAGAQPTIFFSLAAMQQLRGEEGQINQILVVNRCSAGAACSRQAALDLRKALVNHDAAAQVLQALDSSNGRSVLNGLIARRNGPGQAQIRDLLHTVQQGKVSDHLIYLLGDPQVAGTLRATASFLPTREGRAGRVLRNLNRLTVVEVKQSALDQANQYGSILTSSFLVLGLFSIAASLLLVFLVFVMLAAERRGEMGIARAVGLQRSHLVQSFAFEGMLYDLASALLGVAVGVLVAAAVVRLVAHALSGYGIGVQGTISARSLVIAFCLGLLVTFATVLVSAWRVSRVNIVEAIRGIPATPGLGEGVASEARLRLAALGGGLRSLGAGGGRRAAGLLMSAAQAVLTLPAMLSVRGVVPAGLGLFMLSYGHARRQYVVFALGVSLALLGGALLLRWLLLLARLPHGPVERTAWTVAGACLTVFWSFPPPFWIQRHDHLAVSRIEAFALSGVMMVAGVVIVLAFNLAGPLQGLAGLLRRGGAATAAVKMAVAYPLQHRFRTGMAVAMFSLVVFTMVVSAVLLESAHQAYVIRERPPVGYDISATAPEGANLMDINAALQNAPATKPDEFSGVGSNATISAEVVQPSGKAASWHTATVHLADEGMLRGTRLRLSARADGYPSDGAVWDALAAKPGTAVVAIGSLPDGTGYSSVGLSAPKPGDALFQPDRLWLRDTSGKPLRLTVIGVVDDREAFPSGLLTLRSNVATASAQTAVPTSFYFQTRAGRDPGQAALGLDLSFALQGLQTSVGGEGLRNLETVRGLLNYLLEGFVGLGLVSGMAALGVISSRAVVERRQEIGMLRAIGLRRRWVQVSFLLEVSLIALLGVAVGVGLGVLLARNVVIFLSNDFRELKLRVPWGEVGLIALVAYLSALSTTLFAAWQAGRIDPAEALRYE